MLLECFFLRYVKTIEPHFRRAAREQKAEVEGAEKEFEREKRRHDPLRDKVKAWLKTRSDVENRIKGWNHQSSSILIRIGAWFQQI